MSESASPSNSEAEQRLDRLFEKSQEEDYNPSLLDDSEEVSKIPRLQPRAISKRHGATGKPSLRKKSQTPVSSFSPLPEVASLNPTTSESVEDPGESDQLAQDVGNQELNINPRIDVEQEVGDEDQEENYSALQIHQPSFQLGLPKIQEINEEPLTTQRDSRAWFESLQYFRIQSSLKSHLIYPIPSKPVTIQWSPFLASSEVLLMKRNYYRDPDSINELWKWAKTRKPHVRWCNMASFMLHYIHYERSSQATLTSVVQSDETMLPSDQPFSEYLPGDLEEIQAAQLAWKLVKQSKNNTDLDSLQDWLLRRPNESWLMSKVHNERWDQLSRGAKAKYGLSRFYKAKLDFSESLMLLFASRLQGCSFQDAVTVSFPGQESLVTVGDFRTSIDVDARNWMIVALENPSLGPSLSIQELQVEIENRNSLRSDWVLAHCMLENDQTHDLMNEVAARLGTNFEHLPSPLPCELFLFVSREFMMVTDTGDTLMQRYKKACVETKQKQCQYGINTWKMWPLVDSEKKMGVSRPPAHLAWTQPISNQDVKSHFLMTKMDTTVSGLRTNSITASSGTQLSLHPLCAITKRRYPAMLSKTMPNFHQDERTNHLPATGSGALKFDLVQGLRFNDIQATFLLDLFFINKGQLLFENVLRCKDVENQTSFSVSHSMEGLSGDFTMLSFYMWTLYMFSHAKGQYQRNIDSLTTDARMGDVCAEEVLAFLQT